MAVSARDLMLLQVEVDKNAAIIASLRHETALTMASVSGSERAARKHHAQVIEELRTVRQLVVSVQQRVQGGPSVKTSQVDAAVAKLEQKKAELKLINAEAAKLEGILKEFIRDSPLALQELFDSNSPDDAVALAMLLDSRGPRIPEQSGTTALR